MTPSTRTRYFSLWTKACAVKGWSAKDNTLRRDTTLKCMAAVGGPEATTSCPLFGPDEVTALFTYLEFLARPSDLLRSARWVDCQQDYRAFNRARQADWHETKTYGHHGSGKLARNRFGGAKTAEGEALEPFNPKAIYKCHLTMATRHQAKAGRVRAGTKSASTNLASADMATGPDQTVCATLEAATGRVVKVETLPDGNPF
jgi:hypothetical protein